MHKSFLLAAGMLLAASITAGCAIGKSSDSSDDGEPPIGQLLNVTDMRTFTLPLDPYTLNSSNLAATTQAENLLIQRCVARFGLEYKIPPPSDPLVIGKERHYGIVDAELAAVWGYRVAEKPPSEASKYVEPTGEVLAVITGRGRSTYNGQQVPDGGCVGEARRKLAENTPNPPNERLAADLAATAATRIFEDSRARKASADWSACMKKAGFDYADPRKAINDPQFSGDVVTPQEITVATADIRCKKESNYINVLATLETAYQKRALERNAAALAIIKQSIEARERNAATVIAGR